MMFALPCGLKMGGLMELLKAAPAGSLASVALRRPLVRYLLLRGVWHITLLLLGITGWRDGRDYVLERGIVPSEAGRRFFRDQGGACQPRACTLVQ